MGFCERHGKELLDLVEHPPFSEHAPEFFHQRTSVNRVASSTSRRMSVIRVSGIRR